MSVGLNERLRALPSVEEVAAALDGLAGPAAVRAARAEIDSVRARIMAGAETEPDLDAIVAAAGARAASEGGPIRVINATGVVLHTNLGRAPLPAEAVDAVARASAGYTALELDLGSGERGSRGDRVDELVRELTGAEAVMAVNNNAAAVLLGLAATAAGREVVVGRGELVEIGGSFRIPEILEQSGARLVEVGTTNRTRLADYETAIGDGTAAILRVHQSNFRTVGFTEEVPTAELAGLATSHGLVFICDLGSGAVEPIADEPVVGATVASGADLVCFSGDKLLGGPQAGLMAGSEEAVSRCRRHPLARALRLDKLQLAALEATIRLHLDGRRREIPALAMLALEERELTERADRLAAGVGAAAAVGASSGRAGGGALPTLELEGPVCAVDPGDLGADTLLTRLRGGDPPVIARIEEGRVILDPRTIDPVELDACAAAVRAALGDG